MRTVVGRPVVVEALFGFPPAEPVEVVVRRDDGEELSSGQATVEDSTAAWALEVGDVERVDHLVVTFTDDDDVVATVIVEVGGAWYFELEQLRTLPQVEDENRYPDAVLERARGVAERIIERACSASFVSRYRRHDTMGEGRSTVALDHTPRQVFSIEVAGQPVPVDQVATDVRAMSIDLRRVVGCHERLVVAYAGAYLLAPPDDITWAALTTARSRLTVDRLTGAPERATRLTTEVGTLEMAVASPRRPTGIPEVDAVIIDWADRIRVPAVA